MTGALLEVDGLTLVYSRAGKKLTAVKDVDLVVAPGEVVGVVGESGSGKSSLARCIVGLAKLDSGRVLLNDDSIGERRSLEQRREIQMVFQDPRSALNPRLSVFDLVNEAWKTHPQTAPAGDRRDAVAALLQRVGIGPELLERQPRQLSGGQAQRVSIARALAVKPSLLVCDEAVSALDVSVQTQILALLAAVREEFGLAMVFISHDLGVVRQIADRVAVMYLGEIVETGDTEVVFEAPEHEYTKSLLDAALDLT